MKMILPYLPILLTWALVITPAAQAEDRPVSKLEAFELIWQAGRDEIYDESRGRKEFTKAKYKELKSAVGEASDLHSALAILDEFLAGLGVSHTRLYTDETQPYYFLRSAFTERKIDKPRLHHIGLQTERGSRGYVVRTVLEGYPASHSGLRRGDIIKAANGNEFHPYRSFNPTPAPTPSVLTVERNGKELQLPVTPVYESVHLSFLKAMQKSVRKYRTGNKVLGYVHLWTGTHEDVLTAFHDIVLNQLASSDALILDLRDGYGGAWWDYLDAFYPNRENYFVATRISRDGGRTELAPPAQENDNIYSKPMVVLINEGVRSGKEALAYQFKKTGRAPLVGIRTSGSLAAGKGLFTDKSYPFLMYLAVAEMLLDGRAFEGKGVSPDLKVPYSLDSNSAGDPQIRKAIQVLSKGLGQISSSRG